MDGTQYEKKSFKVYNNIKRDKPICFKETLIKKYGSDCINRDKLCKECQLIQGKLTRLEIKDENK